MHIPSTIRTSAGPRLVAQTPMVTVALTELEADLLSVALRQQAEAALTDGDIQTYDRLHTRATAIRESARVVARQFHDRRRPLDRRRS